MFKLRPYQQKASDWCFEHLLTEGNCLLVAPTSAGKTVLLSDVAKRVLDYLTRELGRPAHGICLIGQNEIHQQNLRTFNKYAPNIRTAVFDSNIKSCKGNMIFAMVASIYKYRNKLPMFDFVIADECFAGDTMITTINGKVPIKDVKAGDMVLTYNENTKETEYKKVLKNIKKTIAQPLVKIGDTICTENHKFYTANGWVCAKDIMPGVFIKLDKGWCLYADYATKDNNESDFAKVRAEGYVYDLTVEDNHNYFADRFLVHNCHHSIAPQEFEFIKTLKAKNPKLLVFGVTATPNRGDKVGLLPLFTNYYRIPIGLLFKCGYIVKPTFKVFNTAEPTTEDGHKRFLESVHANKVGKTVVFCRDVATALMYRDLWNSLYENEPSVCVHGELSSGERADVIDKFKSGVAPIIFNVAVLTEGFDEPKIETAVLAKHYGTKGQYIQAVGRALRSAPGKTRAYILDYCGNYTEHGDLQENVDLEGEGKSVKGRNVVLDDLYEGGDVAQNDEVKVDFKESAPQYFTPYGEDLECINWFECDGMGIVGALNTQGLGIIIVGEDCYITHDKVNFEKVPIENLGKIAKNSITTEDKPATAYQLKYLAGKYNIVGITKNRADSVILFDLWRQFS